VLHKIIFYSQRRKSDVSFQLDRSIINEKIISMRKFHAFIDRDLF